MRKPTVNTQPLEVFLRILSNRTPQLCRHRFITTNWDCLLQEVLLAQHWTVQPDWLDNSHVYHLNGTVEILPDNSRRSPFLLVSDSAEKRTRALEADIVFNKMIWDRFFVVVGMSFECKTDKFLLTSLGKVEDDLPIGESSWLVVNPNHTTAEDVAKEIKARLPRADVAILPIGFAELLAADLEDVFRILG